MEGPRGPELRRAPEEIRHLAKRDIFVVIPARGGSKGIAGKNLRLVAGLPLLAWSIEAGKLLVEQDRLLVSTESADLAEVAESYGATVVLRPAALAEDHAATEPVIGHALDSVDAPDSGIVVLLQPTSPLRREATLHAVVGAVLDGATSALTVRRAHDFHWGLGDGRAVRRYERRIRRQDMQPDFVETGSVYASSIGAFRRSGDRLSGVTRLIEVDAWEAHEADSPADLEVLEAIAGQWGEQLRHEA